MAMPRRVNNSGPIGGMFGGSFGRRREQGQQQDADWRQGGHAGSSAPPPPAHEYVLDHDPMLARWLGQVGHNTSPHAMDQLIGRPDYTAVIWQMKKLGLDLRVRALQQIAGMPITADPTTTSAGHVKTRLILEAAWRGLDGYPHGPTLPRPLAISDDNGMLAYRDRLSEQGGMVPYAWIIAYPDGMPPALHYDFAAGRYWWDVEGIWRRPRMATLHAAMCLIILAYDYAFFRSLMNPGGVILPPNPQRFDRPMSVPVHTGMKALLGLGDLCPPGFGCRCNRVLWHIQESLNAAVARVQGADDTDMLPPFPYEEQMQPERHTPPQEHPAQIRSVPLSELHRRPPTRSTPIVPEHHHHHRDEDDGIPDETPMSDQESDGWGRGV